MYKYTQNPIGSIISSVQKKYKKQNQEMKMESKKKKEKKIINDKYQNLLLHYTSIWNRLWFPGVESRCDHHRIEQNNPRSTMYIVD